MMQTPDRAIPRPLAPAVLCKMFDLLPPPGSEFPLQRRAEWLRAFALAAGFCYGFSGYDIGITIDDKEIKIQDLLKIDPDWSE